MCAHTIIAAVGNAGLLVNLVVFVVLGIPTSGGATPTEMLPRVFVAIGTLQPMHQAYLGLRSIMFFDSGWEAGLGHAVWVLGGWAVAGLVVGVAVTLVYERMGMRRQAVADRVPAGRGVTGGAGGSGGAQGSGGLGSARGVRVADTATAGAGQPREVVERDPAHRE